MKIAVIMGTNHNIQEGKEHQESFQSYLTELVQKYGIEAIAEEIGDRCELIVAKNVCENLCITHKIIDPNPAKYKELGITPIHHIMNAIMWKYNLKRFSFDGSGMPPEALDEFNLRLRKEHSSIREKVWLEEILALDTWPVLVVCGANHFEYFSSLLLENGISVNEDVSNWSG